jgi:hypothetical protein
MQTGKLFSIYDVRFTSAVKKLGSAVITNDLLPSLQGLGVGFPGDYESGVVLKSFRIGGHCQIIGPLVNRKSDIANSSEASLRRLLQRKEACRAF